MSETDSTEVGLQSEEIAFEALTQNEYEVRQTCLIPPSTKVA